MKNMLKKNKNDTLTLLEKGLIDHRDVSKYNKPERKWKTLRGITELD